jgi:hypothetical protein
VSICCAGHLGYIDQACVNGLLCCCQACFLSKVLGSQLAEVVVRVDVVERQNKIYEGLAAAGMQPGTLSARLYAITYAACHTPLEKSQLPSPAQMLAAAGRDLIYHWYGIPVISKPCKPSEDLLV